MNQALAERLEQHKQQFKDWRATRQGKRTIPEELWKWVVPRVSQLAQVDHEEVILADFEDFFEGNFLIFQDGEFQTAM